MHPIVCSKDQQRGEVKTLTWTSGFCLGAGIKEQVNRWSRRRPFALTIFTCAQCCGAPGGVYTKLKPVGERGGCGGQTGRTRYLRSKNRYRHNSIFLWATNFLFITQIPGHASEFFQRDDCNLEIHSTQKYLLYLSKKFKQKH